MRLPQLALLVALTPTGVPVEVSLHVLSMYVCAASLLASAHTDGYLEKPRVLMKRFGNFFILNLPTGASSVFYSRSHESLRANINH